MVNKEKKRRDYGVDIIKILAVLCVLSVHFFLNTEYYQTENAGINMKLQSVMRNFFMICVPLFMIATGYLNRKKEYNKSFFKSLGYILIIWLFYSVIEYFVINIKNNNHSALNFQDLLFSITSFKACGYSWYIEMYIGLYLFTPIINNAYESFNEKNKKYLLGIAMITIILPVFINSLFDKTFHLPSWWASIYPLAYYLVGKHIMNFQPKYNKKNLLLLLAFNQVFIFSFSYISSIEFNSFPVFINSVLIFLLLYNVNIKNSKIQSLVKYFSNITLDIYLASSLVDKIIYPFYSDIFNFNRMVQQQIIMYAPLLVLTSLLISAIYGSIRKKLINIR